MNRKLFFDEVRKTLFGGLKPGQVAGMETLLSAFEAAAWPITYAAYGLATVFHETARTMQPIAEYGLGKGRPYGKPDPKTGQTYFGRGFVQLTWLFNYQKAQDELGYPLVSKPALAMDPTIAAAIMVRGMAEGWFTGKANRDYLDRSPPDYVGARRIINGTDKAQLIAGYARQFEAALRRAGYGSKPNQIPIGQPGQALASIVAPSPVPAIKNTASLDAPLIIPPSPEPVSRPGFWSSFFAILATKLKGNS